LIKEVAVPTDERRSYQRFNVAFPIEYKLAAFQEHTTKSSTLDISANGLRLKVKDRPLMGEEIHITIDLPIRRSVKLAARIVWSKIAEDKTYEIGVQLADTKSEDGKIFMDFYSQQLLNFMEANKDQGPVIV
jgi:Tfp pilus assembly protein PilZ